MAANPAGEYRHRHSGADNTGVFHKKELFRDIVRDGEFLRRADRAAGLPHHRTAESGPDDARRGERCFAPRGRRCRVGDIGMESAVNEMKPYLTTQRLLEKFLLL